MLNEFLARLQQKYRTMTYPDGPPPPLPDRFAGKPRILSESCPPDCSRCIDICPTGAISKRDSRLDAICIDLGACLFCRECASVCPKQTIDFTSDYRMAVGKREDLILFAESAKTVDPRESSQPTASMDGKAPDDAVPDGKVLNATAQRLFGRSFKLRQVSAGGCNACEADTNVLGTVGWDLGRFGIQFVASPRHADGLLITGPVPENMRVALLKTYKATPAPKLVIVVGSCAIAGGPYRDHQEAHNGADGLLPVDLYIPGCPPHPLTILDGLLRFVGRI